MTCFLGEAERPPSCGAGADPPAGGYAGALMMGADDPAPAVAAVVTALTMVPLRLFMNRPWEDDLSRAEGQEKIEQTCAMREDIFESEGRAFGGEPVLRIQHGED